MKIKLNKIILAILLTTVLFLMGKSLKSQDILVNVLLEEPYSCKLSDYTNFNDRMVLTLTNNSSESKEMRITLEINSSTGVHLPSHSDADEPVVLNSGESHTYRGVELEELGIAINEDDVDFGSTSWEDITLSGMLPEGNYTICVTAFDFNTGDQLSPDEPEGCYDFEIQFAERPVITEPDDESIIAQENIDHVLVSWTNPAYIGFSDLEPEVEYTLVVADTDDADPSVPLQEIFTTATPLVFEETMEAEPGVFNNYILEDIGLEIGHTYAIRVSAVDLSGRVAYNDGGHSTVKTFTIGGGIDECSVSDPDFHFEAESVFPNNGDTIPFGFIPVVIEITPHCENYTQLNYHHITVENSDPPAPNYDRTPVENIWPRGPRNYLTDVIGAEEPLGNRPWQYITNLREEQEEQMPLHRGKTYNWTVINISAKLGDETAEAANILQNYTFGMTTPVLNSPENQDTLSPGSIDFEFTKGHSPGDLLPDVVKLLAVDRGDTEGALNIGNVRERWVLQISTTDDFTESEIVAGSTGLVDESADQTEESLRENAYGDETFDTEITDNGEYYWRVVWLGNPEMEVPENFFINEEDYYLSSSVRMFVIRPGGSDDGEHEVADKTPCTGDCSIPDIENTSDISSLDEGDSITVGQFTMIITEISQSGHNFTGNGKIRLPFMDDKFLLTEFENIKVNTDNRMYDGVVTGREKETCAILDGLRDSAGNIPQLADSSQVDELVDWIDNAGQLLSNLTSDEEIGIPFGIDTEYGDDEEPIVLGIVSTNFEPRQAMVSIIAAVGFEQIPTTFGFGAQVCVNEGGFTNDSTMFYLPYNHHIPYGEGANEFGIDFKGGEPDDWEHICHVKFGCDWRFISGQIAIEADLPRETFIPVTDDNEMSEDEDEYVKITGMARFTSPKSLLIGLDMDPFFIKDVDFFSFAIEEAWLDLSLDANPPDFEFPPNYHSPGHEGDMINTWKGFYMKQIGAHMDSTVWKYSHDLNVSFQDIIIDADGLTFDFGVYDIIDEEEGTIAEWQGTLDTIELKVLQSNLDKFNIAGRILPPMADEGQWMNYRVVLDLPDSTSQHGNYFMEVNVEDSITVPVWVATMKFYDNSYIRLGVDTSAYISAVLYGKISIDDENADEEERSSIPELNMSGIEFDSLWVSSRPNPSGEYISCAHFGFASPQKSVAGFPIGLSDFELGSTDGLDGFYFGFDLSISLNQDNDSDDSGGVDDSDENNSFSVTAGLRFNASYANRDGGGRKFEYNGISLTSMEIEADFSQIYLHGLLEWEKTADVDQIHGLLEVGLPMGIGCKIEAIFGTYKDHTIENPVYNTSGYYDYWYVYGNVNLGSSGITIGPGVALYAFGGGVYHHMRLKPEYLDQTVMVSEIYSESADTDEDGKAVGNTDGLDANELFERNYRTMIGFQINALIATSGNSSVANFEVGVLAQFSNSGGLELLKIEGAVYVMQAMASGDGNGKLWGTANITYSDYPETGKQFHGKVEIFLNIADVLVGGIDDRYKMVDATFFAGDTLDEEGVWYFHLGSYSDASGISPGAAIKLQIGDIDLAEISAYMMIGWGIPQHLPPPPDKIARLVGLDTQNKNGQRAESETPDIDSDVDYTAMQRGGASQQQLFDGTGFAFGAMLEVDAGWDAFIYFHLYLGIGFDLLITRFEESIECEGFPDPGINRWYAQGQAYAGLEGELGIKFKFFGERKIPLLYLGLGLYMKAYFPNPNYIEGRGGVHFSVLGGLVEGHKTFVIQKGEPCQIVIQDPLANIRFIEDVEPSGTGESVFSTPSVLFNFRMDRDLILPRTIDSETGAISAYYKFKPTVNDFSVRNTSTNNEKSGTDRYSNNRKILKRKPDNAFLGNTQYSINCEVRIKDYTRYSGYNAGGDWYMEDGQVWKEDTTVLFTTGDYPNVIPLENVKYSYPFNNQRYFLQAEGHRKGTVRMFTGMGGENGEGGLFYTEGQSGITYSYVARFVNIEDENATDHVLESPIVYSGGEWVLFDIPVLENEKIYYCQIIRKPHYPHIAIIPVLLTGNSSGSSAGSMTMHSNRPQLLREILNTSTGYATMKVDTLSEDDFIGQDETKLYDFYFRTSKYNRMNEKLQGIVVAGRTPGSNIDINRLEADIEIKNANEDFEDFEIKNQHYNVSGNRVYIPSLYRFVDDYESTSYWPENSPVYNTYGNIMDYGYDVSICKGIYHNTCIEDGYSDRIFRLRRVRRPSVRKPFEFTNLGIASQNLSRSPLDESEIENAWSINWEWTGDTYNMMNFGGTYGSSGSNTSRVMSTFSTGDLFFVPQHDKILLDYSLAKKVATTNESWQEHINDYFYTRHGRVRNYVNGSRAGSEYIDLDTPISSYIREDNSGAYQSYIFVLNRRPSDFGLITENRFVNEGEFGSHWLFNLYFMDIKFYPPLPEEYKTGNSRKHLHYNITGDDSRYRLPGGGLY